MSISGNLGKKHLFYVNRFCSQFASTSYYNFSILIRVIHFVQRR